MQPIVKSILATLLVLCLSSCKVGRFVIYNFANITDYKKFPSRPLEKASAPFKYPEASTNRAFEVQANLDSVLDKSSTVAFLVIRNDSIITERYYDKYQRESIVASFSMAKSVTSMLIGCALQDGLITSVQDPITKYLPELKDNGFDAVTIEHVLQMTSGLKYQENYYSPFSHAAAHYYGMGLRKKCSKLKLKNTPGKQWDYVSGNTQLLGLLLDRVLNGKTVTQYAQEKLWTPLGMEYDASWSTDQKRNAIEKTFCCLNARARDFAKLGSLYLHNGNWQGKQLIPQQWVNASTVADTTRGGSKWYKYQWWLNGTSDYFMDGYRGQFVYVCPEKNMVVVRLGAKSGRVFWPAFIKKLCQKM
ncbi:MAG: hypothetical protein RL660_1527 [Bacteroidota bacterium]|jgi:CubicO group peptidase (beta-lactamase class C family)